MDDSLEARLQATLNVIPANVWYAAPTGALTFVNKRAADYMGLPKDHPLRHGINTGAAWDSHIPLVHPDDHDEARRSWSTTLRTSTAGQNTLRVRNAQGEYRWRISRVEPLRASDGTLLYWIGINFDIEELKRAEFYLAEAQRLAHAGSWAFGDAGFENWSSELLEIHGLKPGRKAPSIPEYLSLVHLEDREFVAQHIQKMLAEHTPFDFTKRIVRPDGAVRHVRCVGTPGLNGRGFVGTGIDVTDQEELTQALRKSEEALRLVVNGIGALVTTYTADGELEFVNQQVLDFFGMTLDELKDWRNNGNIHPDDLDRVVASWTHSLATGQPYDDVHRYRRADGTYRWFIACGRPSRDGEGRILRWYVLLTDIDESQKAKEKLEEQEKELRQVLDLAPQLVSVNEGPDQKRLYANRGLLDYLGTTLDEWRQRSAGSDAHPDDLKRLSAYIARSRSAGAPFEMETRIRKGDGTYRWFLSRFNPMRDDKGNIRRWYVANTDIDDRKRSQERLQEENVALREEIDKTSMFEEIVGTSPALTAVLSRVSKVAGVDSTVLITGETGTGKELIARAIHRRSGRSAKAFVAVNCAAIPRELIASELFGHEKGAFTGAVQRRIGRFELANGGTLFLDEVGELSPDTQVALLRVLQERELERVGGREAIRVDVRVIAATNRDLIDAVANGAFRQDLFYRLNVFPLEMPSLRERKPDIPVLVEYFIHRYGRQAGKTFRRVNRRTLDLLQAYSWPGNVRELQNVIERSVVVCDSDEFTVDESWLSARVTVKGPHVLPSTLAAHEKALIEGALRASGGRVFGPAGAAARLGIPRSTLESRIRALKINKRRFRQRPAKISQ
ncbi:MAG TPA: sigma 54-interacting transcriptional regulator [Steroidobacteraceae bacterium]|nr:sigma 54-interacting transcriptional regulator [Steroidobacteraceae bacterium]